MIEELDKLFPYIIFIYGLFMVIFTHLPVFKRLAHEKLDHQLVQWFYGHRLLGVACLTMGSLWVLQRLIIS